MDAVILVGGFGTRLRPLTYHRPKQLLPVGDRLLIEHVIGRLADQGVTRIVLSLGYRPDDFVEAYPHGECAGLPLVYVVEEEPLGTAGAIRYAAENGGVTERFLALNGDILTTFDARQLEKVHDMVGAEATIHLTPVDEPSRFGVVPTDESGKVQAFLEKTPDPPTNWINAGCYLLEPSVLDRIAPTGAVSIERSTFPAIVEDGGMYAVRTDDWWIDTGTPSSYIQANLDVTSGGSVASSATVHPSAAISESVVMDGVTVEEDAVVNGSVVLPGAHIRVGATVDRSVIGEGSAVLAKGVVRGLVVAGHVAAVDPL